MQEWHKKDCQAFFVFLLLGLIYICSIIRFEFAYIQNLQLGATAAATTVKAAGAAASTAILVFVAWLTAWLVGWWMCSQC